MQTTGIETITVNMNGYQDLHPMTTTLRSERVRARELLQAGHLG